MATQYSQFANIWVPSLQERSDSEVAFLSVEATTAPVDELEYYPYLLKRVAALLEDLTLIDLENELTPIGIDTHRLWASHPDTMTMAAEIVDQIGSAHLLYGMFPMQIATDEQIELITEELLTLITLAEVID